MNRAALPLVCLLFALPLSARAEGASEERTWHRLIGILQYLEESQVAGLANALSRQSSFHYWATGLMSPGTRDGMNVNAKSQLDAAGTSNRFAPASGADWFRTFGWEPVELRVAVDEMVRLHRGPDERILRELVRRAAEDSGGPSGFDGTVLLRRRR